MMKKSFDEFSQKYIDELNAMPESTGVDGLANTLKALSVRTTLKILKDYHEEFISEE